MKLSYENKLGLQHIQHVYCVLLLDFKVIKLVYFMFLRCHTESPFFSDSIASALLYVYHDMTQLIFSIKI